MIRKTHIRIKNKKYQNDWDFQRSFQGFKIFLVMYKVKFDTYFLPPPTFWKKKARAPLSAWTIAETEKTLFNQSIKQSSCFPNKRFTTKAGYDHTAQSKSRSYTHYWNLLNRSPVLYMCRHQHCPWMAANFRPFLASYGPWAGRDLYAAIFVMTLDLGFPSLNARPISRLLHKSGVLRTSFHPNFHGIL